MDLNLRLRTRVELFKGSGEWEAVEVSRNLPAQEAAILICDMWDKHWCASAARRCDAMAYQMARVIDVARDRGVQIIHAPSECMAFYQDMPQRRKMQAVPRAEPPEPRAISDPPLPIDDSDGGCDDENPCKVYQAWTRQHPALSIAAADGISDQGQEVYNLLVQQRIQTLMIMGVHTNMCVLNRSFAIRRMTRWGVRCLLVRDLTDTMYNPRMRPWVSHEEGTALVVEHIEKYWCPTILSDDLLNV